MLIDREGAFGFQALKYGPEHRTGLATGDIKVHLESLLSGVSPLHTVYILFASRTCFDSWFMR